MLERAASGSQVLFITGYWILLTLGLSVVVGLAGLLDLGYVAFFMLGRLHDRADDRLRRRPSSSTSSSGRRGPRLPFADPRRDARRIRSSVSRPCACGVTTWPS